MAKQFSIGLFDLENVREYFDDLKHPIGMAATEAMRDVGKMAEARVRAQVKRNFKDSPHRYRGQRFEKAFRTYEWPSRKSRYRFSYEPAVTLSGNSSWAHVFETGATVFPKAAGALAIPLEDAEKHGLARSTRNANPGDIFSPLKHHQKHSLADQAREKFGQTFLIDAQGGGKIIAAEKNGQLLTLFKLQFSVKMPKLLDFYDTAQWASRMLPAKFAAEFRGAKAKTGN